MADREGSLEAIQEGRARFLELVGAIRPELHRYCARMTGSVTDGEDLVQDTLARAYFALAELESVPELRPWLFTIAHRRAIDHLRRYERKHTDSIDEIAEELDDGAAGADDRLADEEAKAAAISAFLELPPLQRSAVILKDVLGHSLEEIGARLDLGVPAVKAALHRGRSRLAGKRAKRDLGPARPISAAMRRYVALFNARDWDAVRALLASEVRLDLVGKHQRHGRGDVGVYFTNYAAKNDWHHVAPAWLDGREVLAVFGDASAEKPIYFVEIAFEGDAVTTIRDFRYADYVAAEAPLVLER